MTLSGKFLFAVMLVFAVPGLSVAGTLNFDSGVANETPIPNGYGGLNWDNFYALDAVNYYLNPSGYLAGMVSPDFVAFNAYADPAAFSSPIPFNFISAYLTGAWNDGLNIQVQGFLGATLMYDQTVVVNATGPTLFNFNYLGVDRVYFQSSDGTPHDGYSGSGGHFAMDNLTVNIIPEPGSGILLIIGLGGLAAAYAGRRKRTA